MMKFNKDYPWGSDHVFLFHAYDHIDKLPSFDIQTSHIYWDIGDLENLLKRSVYRMRCWGLYCFLWKKSTLKEHAEGLFEKFNAILMDIEDLGIQPFTTLRKRSHFIYINLPMQDSILWKEVDRDRYNLLLSKLRKFE